MSYGQHYVDDFTFPGSLHPVISNKQIDIITIGNNIIQHPILVSIYANISVWNQRIIETYQITIK